MEPDGFDDPSRAAWRAERARCAGDPALAVRIASEALAQRDDAATRVALALGFLDLGDASEVRHALEALLDLIGGDDVNLLHAGTGLASVGMIPDTTLAAATADTLELVGSLDEASFERAFESAEAERELMLDADRVAEHVLETVPAEIPDEILPSADSPFATRTFADLLERQGHGAEAESLRHQLERGTLQETPEAPAGDRGRALDVLERWLRNLDRSAA